MQLASKYDPSEIEQSCYDAWERNGLFRSVPDERPAYTIVIPPPNVTGMLHMGHMLNNTIQDVLIRRARMQGFNACWVPGTDHASIATEAKVVAMLKERGIDKSTLSREEFLQHALEWKEKYGGIILKQLRRLGCSCDWDRTKFTMDPDLYASVIRVFVDMHEKGLIYRGNRMVNWDPVGKTALSDEEVIYTEEDSQLYYLRYKIVGGDGHILVATTRPETILGDTAVCVHPDDARFAKLKGARVIVPLVNREVPVIFDDYVDPEFGTGALKVTPAHDINDYELGKRHNLEVIDIFNDDASIAGSVGMYSGINRFELRKQIARDLQEAELIEKIESHKNKVGRSERTRAIIEPRLSRQWFVDMQAFMKRNPEVLDHVMNDTITMHPSKFKNTYRHWIEGIKDWCISRQLWWGHQIPAYYLPDGSYVVAESRQSALEKARTQDPQIRDEDLTQDDDVMDTWFSAWLWPISVFNGILEPQNDEIRYYYPTSTLVTAPDIIFFWVARMIMSGYEYRKELPFKDVYFTGIVRDKQRRKMSKQLGNSPDPIGLMDQFGTDGVRLGLLLSAPAGNDLLFDEALCEQGRNFCNKLWNAFRLISGWETNGTVDPWYDAHGSFANSWMRERIDTVLEQVEEHFEQFRISDALMAMYKLIWDDFCSSYLEMIKPTYGTCISDDQLEQVKSFFDEILRLLHPITPFITEHIWQTLHGDPNRFINQSRYPVSRGNRGYSEEMDFALNIISTARSLRSQHGLSPKVPATLRSCGNARIALDRTQGIISRLANIVEFETDSGSGITQLVGASEFIFDFEGFEGETVDVAKLQDELDRLRGFLIGIEKKLGNEKFIANANPEVVAREQQKMSDTLSKIASIERELSQAGK
ncbi:MAG: valine--tRNA ligase [Flavobacteriales bacterium]|nr:valine--tRNA ligase [Flavobacteriales bacterium]